MILSELEKIALYTNHDPKGKTTPLTLADIQDIVDDNHMFSLEDIAFATASGDLSILEKRLEEAFLHGQSGITLLRAVMRHFQRLHRTVQSIKQGTSVDQALKNLRPPVFFRRIPPFRHQLRLWSPQGCKKALFMLTHAEIESKKTARPQDMLCHRALLTLACTARKQAHA